MNECPYEPRTSNRPHQGSVYRNIKVITATSAPGLEKVKFSEWELPYVVALSQECDLALDHDLRETLNIPEGNNSDSDRDKKHDKLLLGVLVCPAYQAASFREGKHLDELHRVMESYASKDFSLIKKNCNPRYHYLAKWTPLQVAELVVDFKHFFTVPVEQLRDEYGTEEHYIARLKPLYREDLSQRCSAYLTRIGIPTPHHLVGKPPI